MYYSVSDADIKLNVIRLQKGALQCPKYISGQ